MTIGQNETLHWITVEDHEAPSVIQFPDHFVFQTPEWVHFVAIAQNATPVFAVLKMGDKVVGRFAGLMVNKMGLRILGSPLPGWSTAYMGFNLMSGISRLEALKAMKKYAFSTLKCHHLELMDRNITQNDFTIAGFRYRIVHGFEIDLNQNEATLFNAMKPACRRCIRKSEKTGVVVESVWDESFADLYYSQLQDVFRKQNLTPTYSLQRVRLLIKQLLPTGNLLLVKASDQNGNCIATGIFPALNQTMYFWGGASWREFQEYRPNEAVQWFAMRYWKTKGITRYDMGGGGEYKRKYGGEEINIPWGRISRNPFIELFRNTAKAAFSLKQRIKAFIS